MTARSPRTSKFALVAGAAIAFAAALLVGMPVASAGPCDIYASGGTPCVAAHSTTRALFNAYSGPLYQVRRASDNATTNINTLSAGLDDWEKEIASLQGKSISRSALQEKETRMKTLSAQFDSGRPPADTALKALEKEAEQLDRTMGVAVEKQQLIERFGDDPDH